MRLGCLKKTKENYYRTQELRFPVKRERDREEFHGKDEWKRQTINYASDSYRK